MEERRLKERLRVKAGEKAVTESLPQQCLESDLYSNTNAELLRSTLDCPVYHPHYGKVMTDEQLEILKRQISVYATICQQLVEMHKATVASQSQLNGTTAGEHDQSSTASYKAAARQRWTPSQAQLQILERLFDLGIGTPNKQKVKEITSELSQHGSITESNVYNWFQNRKARSKRRQQQISLKDGDSELDTDADSPKEKRQRQDSPYNDPDASQSVAESRPSEKATSSNTGTVLIFVNGKLCEVPAGIFNVKNCFGETKVLLNDQGQIIGTNESGVILQPLRAGDKYTLSEIESKTEPDNFSSLMAQIEAITGGSEVFFAKRSMLPVHR